MGQRYRATCRWKGDSNRPNPPTGAVLKGNVKPSSGSGLATLPPQVRIEGMKSEVLDDRLSGCLPTLAGMASRISELVIDAADPDRLAAFWSNVLGYVELGREDDGSIEIGPPDVGFGGPQPTLVISPSSDPRTEKLRLHIDVSATDRDQDAELERLLALGARPADVGQTGTESWHVLADPEGNEFCLLHTRLEPL
jgi:catechol 2,3-dioxygenase-like lactoylglutathione lyase family enzyme